ncbi:MAG: FAD-dependent oxidoreductase, partial [Acetatifactor sp.]|nr:FAD-dependent oxidoreductase [Acetatifactor sp.]
DQLVLAIGHSARDTFYMLQDKAIPMEAKSFAVGLRVEHPQKMINKSQYGQEQNDILGAAPYKVTAKTSTGRGVYSFCMCPGGYVVNASSEEKRLVVNGMSYSGRSGDHANSAIIVAVTPKDYGSDGPLAGIEFQRTLEERAYRIGNGKIPVQRYGIFKECVLKETSQENLEKEHVQSACESGYLPDCKGQYTWADVTQILPEECNKAFVEGMDVFGRQIKGFNQDDTLLLGVESRTSSPVRIHRDERMQSNVEGLYPCGEGAGYAGGITSAAMDGMRVAEQIASEFAPI